MKILPQGESRIIMTRGGNFAASRDENRRFSLKSGQSLSHASFKSGLSAQQSLTSQVTDVSNTSFHELVGFNDEGHPYIDINRLIYKPVTHHHHYLNHQEDKLYKKEKLSWYVPDFSFIVFNLIGLGVSTYFCLIGATTLSWQASMEMFSVPKCNLTEDDNNKTTMPNRPHGFYYRPCQTFLQNDKFFTDELQGYDWKNPNSFPILRTKLTDVHYFGLVLICIELVNLINVIVGINACLQGYKLIMIQHIAVDTLICTGEFIICAVVAFTSTCEKRDLKAIRVVMDNFVHWYGIIVNSLEDETGKQKLINQLVDGLQIGLGCCGVDGWTDYLAAAYPYSDWTQSTPELDDTEMVIPFSCCRSWWIRNIYCSHGVHNWAHPLAGKEMAQKFQERIVPEGCVYKLEKLCLNLRAWMGHYGFAASLLHLICVVIEAIAAVVLIKNINTLIRERKLIERHKEMFRDDKDSEMDYTSSTSGRKSLTSFKDVGKATQWGNVAPPTEDEVLMIKHKSNFTNFMARMKGGLVGQWMNEAQMLVTEGHLEAKKEDISIDGRIRREMKLVHDGKQKQTQRAQENEGIQQRPAYDKPKQIVKKNKLARLAQRDAKKRMDAKIERALEPEVTEILKPVSNPRQSLVRKSFLSRRSLVNVKPSTSGVLLDKTKSSKFKGKKTKVLFRKSIIEADDNKSINEEPLEENKMGDSVEEHVEAHPLLTTEEESGMTTATDDDQLETRSTRRRKKKKKKKKLLKRLPWKGAWWW